MDQRIIFRITQEYPPVSGGGDTIRPNGVQYRIIRDEITLLACFLVDPHGTATEHTCPDVTPTVFCDAPDVIGHQSTARVSGAVVAPLAVLILQDTALIRAEPQAAILSRITAYDDITGHAEPPFRECINGLQGLGVQLDDTAIITANPVIALLVLADGIDITDIETDKVRH